MKYFDFHCDTISVLYNDNKSLETLIENNQHVDFKRLITSGYQGQCFACFVNLSKKPRECSHYHDVHNMIDMINSHCHRVSECDLKYIDKENYYQDCTDNKLSVIISVEEAGILENQIKRLDALYDKGVRIITLTWNHENCIGYSNKNRNFRDKGLKDFGLDVVRRMDELGIIIDVSHLSDAGFYDVYNYGKRPFIATHSNSREILNHSRNLTDDMIQKIASKGGIIGLNFYGYFLQENGICTFEAMCKHIAHIIKIGGSDILCLGSDFDGIDCEMPFKGCQDISLLSEAMLNYGFSFSTVEKICYLNSRDFFVRYYDSKTNLNL